MPDSNESENAENQKSIIDTRPGAVRFIFTERTMKMICIHESELNNLSLLDTWVNFLLAIVGFSIGIISTILLNWISQNEVGELNRLSWTVIIIFAVIAFVALGFAIWMIISKKSQIKTIKATSKIVSDTIKEAK